jgi:translation initiation factor 3 subunit I
MKPILLKGHERPITKIKYNREGDLLFSCSKDNIPTVWYTHNGERLGTYNGHSGAVWDCDVSWDSTRLVTASSDRSAKLWDVQNGKILHSFEHKAVIRSVNFSHGGMFLAVTQDSSFKATPTIFVYSVPGTKSSSSKEDEEEKDGQLLREFKDGKSKDQSGRICDALFGPLNLHIISGHEDGSVRKWNVETGVEEVSKKEHTKQINSVQFSKDQTMFITASSDQTAKLWDTKTMTCLKTYISNRPLNAAAISPIMKHIIVGGGQEAINVTQTIHKSGHFEVDFHHLVNQELYGIVKGHFGPVHTLAFSPDGKGYASGSEDGYVRLHHFPTSYFKSEDKL